MYIGTTTISQPRPAPKGLYTWKILLELSHVNSPTPLDGFKASFVMRQWEMWRVDTYVKSWWG